MKSIIDEETEQKLARKYGPGEKRVPSEPESVGQRPENTRPRAREKECGHRRATHRPLTLVHSARLYAGSQKPKRDDADAAAAVMYAA